MKNKIWTFAKSKTGKWIIIPLAVILLFYFLIAVLYEPIFEAYTGLENGPLTYDSSKKLTDSEFEAVARQITRAERLKRATEITKDVKDSFARQVRINMLMNTPSFLNATEFKHIKYFRDAGIRQYEGPKTCIRCHETMTVHLPDGSVKKVNTMDDVMNSIHFLFQRTASGFTIYGYDGREVNGKGIRPIPVGKIDRACGIPGSFSWTGWAALIKTHPAHSDTVVMRSEGCGGCHVGGNYQPATEAMLPGGKVPKEAQQGIDCLICHSQTYDMNYKYVIKDKRGLRWNQDRTMKAAMAVTKPTAYNCLTCHQHDLGGDVYKYNEASKALGYKNKRILHEGTKRGTAFSAHDDVHAKAGMVCTDCHVPEGHKIPRGTKGVDLVSNDLPGKPVSCESCHTSAPHTESVDRVILNGHVGRLACETCHITHLQEENVVLRDWVHPTWSEEEGMYVPTDIYRSGETNKGFIFLWFNGKGTYLANALGDNPSNPGHYDPLNKQLVEITDPEIVAAIRQKALELKKVYKDLDVDQYVHTVTHPLSQLSTEMRKQRSEMIRKYIRPIMEKGQSKIYPFKLFNAMMYEDMGNQGPFGAMIMPFDYPIYYEKGDPKLSVFTALQMPIMKRMYELPFKEYMMDEYMHYFGVKTWNTTFPIQNGKLHNVEPHWMRQMGTLMVNHGIVKEGRTCVECHSPHGIMDFKALGYSPERIKDLQNLPELKTFHKL